MPPALDLTLATAPLPRRAIQRWPLVVGLLAAALGALRVAQDGWRPPLLWLVGIALGLALYHASFGFASGYRRMFVERDMRGVQAQLLQLALTTLLFAPVLAGGSVFGQDVGGAWAPVGVSVVVGAFLFGIGMQLAGGCGSGTLYTAGGGNLRMLMVLGAACAGSFWASLHLGWWQRLPSHDAVVLGDALGWPLATAVQLAVLGLLAWLLRRLARPTPAARSRVRDWRSVLAGPWPIIAGAILLALGNLATLAIAGHPWSITWAFTLWGAKGATLLGWQPASSAFWQDGWPREVLAGGVLADTTSMMDLALMLGALCAASLAGRFAPTARMPWRSVAAALLGGLAIGYGARIAYGCNIGAFVSGVASGSLHGWLWIAAALPGTWLGIRLRRRFGLAD
ncbi:MAG: YeeE/YedE family protein [Burkholderiales bacterium]|nr:YeeE/YedE family protein [Burkholderiales bacterium]